MRRRLDGFGGRFPAGVTGTPVDVDGTPAEWVADEGAAEDAAVLYLHGGGYVAGSIDSHRNLLGHLARAMRCRVLAVEYRLAPEHPHPAAVEDATAAYRWLVAQGIDPSRIVIAGDSAGRGSHRRHPGGAARRRRSDAGGGSAHLAVGGHGGPGRVDHQPRRGRPDGQRGCAAQHRRALPR